MRTRSRFTDSWHSDLWGMKVRILDHLIADALLSFRAETGRWPRHVKVVEGPVDPMSSVALYRPMVTVGDTFDAGSGENWVWSVPATLEVSTVQDAFDAGAGLIATGQPGRLA